MQPPSSKSESGRSKSPHPAKVTRRLEPISSSVSAGQTANRLGRRRRMLGQRASQRLNRRERLHARRTVHRAIRFGVPVLLLGLLGICFVQDGYILVIVLAASTVFIVTSQRLEKAFRDGKNHKAGG